MKKEGKISHSLIPLKVLLIATVEQTMYMLNDRLEKDELIRTDQRNVRQGFRSFIARTLYRFAS
jgi:hypothetical protein